VHADTIFLLKQSLLGCVTIEFFGAILLYTRGNELSAVLFFVCGIYDMTAFVYMYCNSYRVKSGIAQARTTLKTLTGKHALSDKSQLCAIKIAKSIPKEMGIKAGTFGTISEGSSTEFLDFVIQQTSSLVITYTAS